MRKLLFATAAVFCTVIGLTAGGHAQSVNLIDPITKAFSTRIHSASRPIPTQGPGTFVIHLDGSLNWYAGVSRSSLDNVGGVKTTVQDFQGYMRLYPGFTAEAANGLQYGVAAEAWMPGKGGGFAGVNPGATSSSETLFWRRAYGFVATPQLGTLRFGMGDGITTLFEVGTFPNVAKGGWGLFDFSSFVPPNAKPIFPFAINGVLYTSNKITYISPRFSGFMFGFDYEPNTANLYNDSGCGTGASGALTCNTLISQGIVGSYPRRRNTVSAGVEYAKDFDGVGIDASLTGMDSGVVANTSPHASNYNGLALGRAGLTVSFGGFTIGGNITGGQMNGEYGLQPEGSRDSFGWLVGADYKTGPFLFGATYFQNQFAGNWRRGTPVASTENDTGVSIGITYNMAPGLDLFGAYLYGTKHQVGWNFVNGAPGAGSNNTHAQVLATGVQLTW